MVFHKHPLSKTSFVEELGDFNYYKSEIANIWGIDLQLIWDIVKYPRALNMKGVKSDLTDIENKVIDELINLDKSAADLAFTIRNRSNWQPDNKASVSELVEVLIYSIIESEKAILRLLNIKIETVLRTNVEKLEKRFPNGFNTNEVDTNG